MSVSYFSMITNYIQLKRNKVFKKKKYNINTFNLDLKKNHRSLIIRVYFLETCSQVCVKKLPSLINSFIKSNAVEEGVSFRVAPSV